MFGSYGLFVDFPIKKNYNITVIYYHVITHKHERMNKKMTHFKKLVTVALSAFALSIALPATIPSADVATTVEAATVKLNKKKITIAKGESSTLKVTGTKKKVTWSTSKKSVVTVKRGKITGKKKGSATITAKVGKKRYTCKVKVETPSLNTTNVTLEKGKSVTLKLKGNSRSITWKSNNSKVAKINKKGKITGVTPGTATITAKVGKKKYSCYVVVSNKKLPIRNTFPFVANGYTVKELSATSELTSIGKYRCAIVGSFINTSPYTLSYISFKFDAYDANGAIVESDLSLGSVQNVTPGATYTISDYTYFEREVAYLVLKTAYPSFSPYDAPVNTSHIAAPAGSLAPGINIASASLSAVINHGTFDTYRASLDVTVNYSSSTSINGTVVATCLDASGNVIYTGDSYIYFSRYSTSNTFDIYLNDLPYNTASIQLSLQY